MAAHPSVHAAVVFLKMQEFARRPVTEQARLRAQLEAVVAVTTADLDAEEPPTVLPSWSSATRKARCGSPSPR